MFPCRETARKYTPEAREQAVRLVVDTRRRVAHVAAEIGVGEQLLSRWVAAAKARSATDNPVVPDDDERAELERLRKERRITFGSCNFEKDSTDATSAAAGALRVSRLLLNDEAADGMTDGHGASAKRIGGGAHVVEIVRDRARTKRPGQVASAMAAPTDRDGSKAPFGEEVQKVVIPAPGRVQTDVNEQQRYRVRLAARTLVDHFEHARP